MGCRVKAPATILVAAFAAGCVSKPISVEANGQQRWAASDMVDVAIPEADRNRTDEFYGTSGTKIGTVATGPFWTRIFSGDPHTSPVFTIKSAKTQSELIAGGMAARVHYIVDGSLSFEGHDYPIHAEGARAAAALSSSAASEAIQLGIVDAAHKVKFIVSGGLKQ